MKRCKRKPGMFRVTFLHSTYALYNHSYRLLFEWLSKIKESPYDSHILSAHLNTVLWFFLSFCILHRRIAYECTNVTTNKQIEYEPIKQIDLENEQNRMKIDVSVGWHSRGFHRRCCAVRRYSAIASPFTIKRHIFVNWTGAIWRRTVRQ